MTRADEAPASGGVRYTEPQLDEGYRASTEFDPQGMEHLYYVTNLFLDAIQQDDRAALDQRQLETARKAGNLTETFVHLGLYDWSTLVHHHLGYAILAGVGIVLALLTPFIGLIVCCCRCSGKCGGRVEPYDKRKDTCRRWCNGIFLSLLVLLILFGVVGSFVVNEYVERGVTEVPPRLHVAVNDSQLYVQNTKLEVNHLLKNNYMELTEVLDESLEGCGDRIKTQLATISRAVAVENLTAIAEGLGDIRRDLTAIADQSQLLQNKADQLGVGLQDARAELTVLLRSCELPDVSRTAREISALIENGIESEVRSGKQALDQLSERIQAEVAAIVPEVRQSISREGIQLQGVATNITSVLDEVQLRPAHRAIDEANDYLRQYGAFRYYVFLIISGLVLIITFCLTVGIFCGFCGRRPGNVYGDGTCNKGTGANFLISGTFFYFLFGWLLLLLITCMFLLGGLAQFYLCDGLANPSAPGSGLAILQAVYPLEKLLPQLEPTGFDVAEVVSRCHRNQSIYKVLNLEPVFDISQISTYKRNLGLDDQLDRLRDEIRVDTDIEILTPRARQQLIDLAETDLAQVNYTAFAVALKERVLSIDLRNMGRELESAAQELPNTQRSVATKLRNQAIILMAHQRVAEGMAEIVDGVLVSFLTSWRMWWFSRTPLAGPGIGRFGVRLFGLRKDYSS
ncbi:prominin-1-like [Pollicipes pollicipes]|uniref:prominin-1-like n=1 Tax=Pollicipes pollicipes TaxID=41117 RepID=UPI0018851CC6|nr:prominin-1-like [Pollicipes pollicipes]